MEESSKSPGSSDGDDVASTASRPVDEQEIFGPHDDSPALLNSKLDNYGTGPNTDNLEDADDFGEFISTASRNDGFPNQFMIDTSIPKFYERKSSTASITRSISTAFSRLDTSKPYQPVQDNFNNNHILEGGGTGSGAVTSFEPLEMDNHNDSDVGGSGPESGHDDDLNDVSNESPEADESITELIDQDHGISVDNTRDISEPAIDQPTISRSSEPYHFPRRDSSPVQLTRVDPTPMGSESPMLISSSTGSPLIQPSTPESIRGRQIHSIDGRFHTRMSSNTSGLSGNLFNRHLDSVSSLLFGRSSGNVSPKKKDGGLTTPVNANIETISGSASDELLSDLPYQNTPWEPVRWSKLRKISNQLYSESAHALYGQPTCVYPASFIAVGMSRGHVLIFDYQQNLKHVLGLKAKLPEWGEVTSLAVSFDHTFVGVGYSQGHIVTWELAKPNNPNIHIYPLENNFDIKPNDDKEGHIKGASVIHLAFINKRHSALISADSRGMAFAHDTVRNIRRHVNTKRILGRYRPQPNTKNRPMTIFACAPRPTGHNPLPEDLGLVAIMTPYLLVVVSIHPQIRTQLKLPRSKEISSSMGLSACLAWFPAPTPTHMSKLAYSWSNVVHVVDVSLVRDPFTDDLTAAFSSTRKLVCDESIVAIQWIDTVVSWRVFALLVLYSLL
ncbi:hypothetical protein AWJ20_508 [Sugiyamaella lignohabitans]|uniref:Uncharacterized protein n=1 Tax=Sugiyamaella lignohabitans TaxID=796027 RepID=A0A167CYG2_9ASCO|nr:uncharacterized protein AWJ20_508 [Sugiyamaella lignohabitans]ANB12259.1 hypothetical protein AWJ20_508 [Sugiyamaella lignohabitans]